MLAILRPELACAEDAKLTENNTNNDNPIALKLDQVMLPITAPSDSEKQASIPKVDLRIKLRMSKSINNFDVLNKTTDIAEIDPLTFKKQADAENEMLANGGVIIEGDRLEVQLDRTMTSLGNASLKTGSNVILGDRIEFDSQNHATHSAGHASMEGPDSLVKGPSFHLNIDDNTGEMPNASFFMYKPLIKISPLGALGDKLYGQNPGLNNDLLSGVVDRNMMPVNGETKPVLGLENTDNTEAKKVSSRGDAEMLFFEGDSKKRLLKSRYTTCEVGSDDWYIKSGQLKINDETKTAVATNATVEFKGVPILYTPWINFPYANQRKSGLLAPTWGTTTKSGFEVLTPFYWNISPNMDATIASRYLSKRGLQGQGELRYLEENYAGILAAEYLPSDDITNNQRYFAKIKHQHNFGDGWTAGIDAQKVSDDQYFSDLSTHIITTSKVNLLQQANINYAGDVWQFGALAQKYQTLDKISYPYQRMPQMTLNGSKDWDWGTSRIQNQLTRFESDPSSSRAVKAGTRFSTYPSISIPMVRPYGYITPKIGINYTSYSLDSIDPLSASAYDKTADRTLPIVSLDSGLFFERDTRIVSRNYTQTLEPRLFYVYIPYQDQSRLPVFDTGIADLNMGTMFIENQYTGGDRINNANQMSMSLSSRLIDANTGEQRFATSIGQRFYFEDQKVGLPNEVLRFGASSDIVAAATARLVNKWNIDAAWQYNNNTGETVKGNIGTRYNPEPGKVLNLSYRFTQNNLEQINASTQWPLGRGYYGLARANYSIREGSMIEGLAGIEYDAGCWQSRFVVQRVQTATADANFAMFFQLELGGIASIGSNPLQLINRNIPGYKSSGLLPDNYRQLYNE
ncbi:LPS-assembly protein LptD [Candidatus Methylopumilus turicensis]|uniref:LPS-assembly protein LptD n=2 Tax=Candidatus Methylopumilus turicensis TaxID=1581680 RepID=A0A0B7IT84_9PROT|nr:LPS-assembly protein LptD [Candidatus Methylopumilus turicensis]